MKESLLDRTYRLLDTTELSYRDIAHGADVGFEWLKSLASRRIGEPGVSKVQAVYDFLSSQASATKRRPKKVAGTAFHTLTPNE